MIYIHPRNREALGSAKNCTNFTKSSHRRMARAK
jgi:hypothetical protein